MNHAELRVVRLPTEHSPRDPAPAGADVALLAFIFALHAVPLVALVIGHAWGAATEGYATAVVLLTGRELVHEFRTCCRAARIYAR